MRFHPPKPKSWPIASIVTILTLAFLLPTSSCLFAIGASTLTYQITPDEVVIVFGPSTSRIEREAIQEVQLLDRPTPIRRARIAGTSVPGHHLGHWTFEETGRVMLYATTLQSLVLLETENQKWALSPQDTEGFVAALRGGGTGNFAPVPTKSRLGLFVYALLPPVLLAAVGYPINYMLRVRRCMGYELAPDEMIIHGASKPVVLPYTHIDSVEIAEPQGTPQITRGLALSGLYCGSFSWRNVSQNLKLYATRLRPLILIKSGDVTYGLSPEEPERFIAALNERLPGRDHRNGGQHGSPT